jgi:hypothetical protein
MGCLDTVAATQTAAPRPDCPPQLFAPHAADLSRAGLSVLGQPDPAPDGLNPGAVALPVHLPLWAACFSLLHFLADLCAASNTSSCTRAEAALQTAAPAYTFMLPPGRCSCHQLRQNALTFPPRSCRLQTTTCTSFLSAARMLRHEMHDADLCRGCLTSCTAAAARPSCTACLLSLGVNGSAECPMSPPLRMHDQTLQDNARCFRTVVSHFTTTATPWTCACGHHVGGAEVAHSPVQRSVAWCRPGTMKQLTACGATLGA